MAATIRINTVEEQNQITKKERATNFLCSKAMIAILILLACIGILLGIHYLVKEQSRESKIEDVESNYLQKPFVFNALPDGYYLSVKEYGHYTLALKPMNFSEGKKYCNALGANILEFQNCPTRECVVLKISTLNKYFNLQGNVYIGLTDIEEEGVWRWESSGKILPMVVPSFWKKGNPDNHQSKEHCAHLNGIGKPLLGFNDITCESKQTVICESEKGFLFYRSTQDVE